MKSFSDRQKGIIALVILAFFFGVIAVVARYLSFYSTLLQQLYMSLGTAFVISLFIFPKTITVQKIKSMPRKDWYVILFRIVTGYILASIFYRTSITLTKISNVTFIQSIPIAAILGWILFKEKFSFKKLIFIFIAYLGVLLIAIKDYSSLLSFGQGELFSLISAVFFALSYVAAKWQSKTLNDKESAQVLIFLGFIILFALSLIKGEGLPTISWSVLLVVALLITGFINAVNIFLINYGFRNVHVVLASNILTLEAVFALILAFLFYQELPTLKELTGGVIILASVIGMNRLEEKEK